MTVIWSPRAEQLLTAIDDHIAGDNAEAADRVTHAILSGLSRLTHLPYMGRPGRVPGTRELVITGTPYLVPYRIKGDRVEILAVLHGRQKWPANL